MYDGHVCCLLIFTYTYTHTYTITHTHAQNIYTYTYMSARQLRTSHLIIGTPDNCKTNNYWPRGRFSDIWPLIKNWSRGRLSDIRLKREVDCCAPFLWVGCYSGLFSPSWLFFFRPPSPDGPDQKQRMLRGTRCGNTEQ